MNELDPHPVPSREEILELLRTRRNWGRWGEEDERGTLNLITPEKVREAAALVRSGRSVSLSRPFPKDPSVINAHPAMHFLDRAERGESGMATDFYGIQYHGLSSTHIDALCHIWDKDGMYNGRQPDDVISTQGSRFGSIDAVSSGIVTRGVLLDVPLYRGEDFVTWDRPVHGWELEALCRDQGIDVTPGDALIVYSGREAWGRAMGRPWGSNDPANPVQQRPGLHASTLEFIRNHDCSVLVWDMMDQRPNGLDLDFAVHAAIHSFGLTLVDNAMLEAVAAECRAQDRHDFMFVTSPLVVEGGTGSPANPLAIL